ncbi:MAG: ABC transporter permease subunit [Ignavibacteriales bacterium]
MLIRQHWRREAPSLISWSIILFTTMLPMTLSVELVLRGTGMEQISRLLEQLPPALRSFMGPTAGQVTLNMWAISLVFRTMAPLLLTIYTAMATLTILTREADAGVMDFLMALPIRRSRLMLSRFLVLVCNLAILHAVLLSAASLGAVLLGYELALRQYALIAANGYLVQLALASLLLVVSIFVDDYTQGLFVTIGLGLGLYFLSVTVEPRSSLAWLGKISFFSYSRPDEIMRTGVIPWSDSAVLAGAVVVLVVAAAWLFERKQVSA